MKFTVFDDDVESFANWRRFGTNLELEFQNYSDLDQLENKLPLSTQVIVIDDSVVPGDLAKTVSNYCLQNRQHLFVATGNNLSVHQTVQLLQHEVAWVFDKPLKANLVQPALTSIIRQAKMVADMVTEYRRLQMVFDRLTDRENQVLKLILNGTSNKDAAELLNISIRTVEARRAKVYQKTENDSVVGLVRMCERLEVLRLRFTPLPSERTAEPHHIHLNLASRVNHDNESDNDLKYATG